MHARTDSVRHYLLWLRCRYATVLTRCSCSIAGASLPRSEHPTSLGTLFSQCSFDTQRALSPLCTRYQHAASDRGSDGTGAPTGVDSAGEGGGVGGSAAGFPHEAGYDAYMTGCVLLDLAAKHGGAGGDVLAFLRTPPPSLVNHSA